MRSQHVPSCQFRHKFEFPFPFFQCNIRFRTVSILHFLFCTKHNAGKQHLISCARNDKELQAEGAGKIVMNFKAWISNQYLFISTHNTFKGFKNRFHHILERKYKRFRASKTTSLKILRSSIRARSKSYLITLLFFYNVRLSGRIKVFAPPTHSGKLHFDVVLIYLWCG